MRKFIICNALFALGLSTGAVAHPTHLLFENRGQCEKEQAAVNNFDREHVAMPIFGIQNNGEAQVFFLESFQCEYDDSLGAWRMVNHMGDQSGIGSAWDD